MEALKEEFGVEFRCQIGAHEVINFMSWNLLFSAKTKGMNGNFKVLYTLSKLGLKVTWF